MIISGHQHIKFHILVGSCEELHLSDPVHGGERARLAVQDPSTADPPRATSA